MINHIKGFKIVGIYSVNLGMLGERIVDKGCKYLITSIMNILLN